MFIFGVVIFVWLDPASAHQVVIPERSHRGPTIGVLPVKVKPLRVTPLGRYQEGAYY